MKKSEFIIFFSILLLAAVLRFTGINWGLNNTKYFHAYSYHSDEHFPLNELRMMNPKKLDFRSRGIQALATGPFIVYPTGITLGVAKVLDLVRIVKDYNFYKLNSAEFNKLYLCGRLNSLIFSILGVIIVFLIGKKFFSTEVGLIASWLVALNPLNVIYSHYLSRDTMQLFWILLILYFSLKILDKKLKKHIFLSGFFVGVCVSTKYNGVVTMILPIVAIITGNLQRKELLSEYVKDFLLVGVSMTVGFLVTNPYFFHTLPDFWKYFKKYTLGNILIGSENLANFNKTRSPVLFYLFDAQYYGFGIFLWSVAVISFLYGMVKKNSKVILMISFVVVYTFLLIRIKNWLMVRWVLPLLGVYCLSAGWFCYELYMKGKFYKMISVVVILIISIYNFLYSFSYAKMMARVDTRDLCSEYIEKVIPENESIGTIGVPYTYEPSLVQSNYWYVNDKILSKRIKKYKIVVINNDSDLIKYKPRYLCLSEYRYFPLSELDKQKYQSIDLSVAKAIERNYQLVKIFGDKPRVFGLTFFKEISPPPDLKCVSPRIFLYRSKDEFRKEGS